MIDKWKKAVDNHKAFGAVLIDLSKVFVCICHDLLIAKLNGCGLSLPALKLITDYLQNQKQRTKIGGQSTVIGKILFQEFHKVQYLGPCYLISFYVTYFLKTKIIILQITLTTPFHTLLVALK